MEAAEPRYVAPTLRDRIGRIWAPVYINGKGPYRLVLDSGASRSAVTAAVAADLGIAPDPAHSVLLRGVTGTAAVPTIHVDKLSVGDLEAGTTDLPIVPEAFGGADGVLGTDGLAGRRVSVDFLHDRITIKRSRGQAAENGFLTIPFFLTHGRLPTIVAYIGRTPVKVVIDTGGQASIGNLALRRALEAYRREKSVNTSQVTGVTGATEEVDMTAVPMIRISDDHGHNGINIRENQLAFGDVQLFEQWKLTREPVLLLGMDAIGTLDKMVLDFRLQEIQLQLRDN